MTARHRSELVDRWKDLTSDVRINLEHTLQVTDPQNAFITILMAVYNGADFLDPQLASIRDQTHQNWQLVISDDGSCDGSQKRILDFATETGKARLMEGPARGGTENFMSLLRAMSAQQPTTGWLAFSDQDDIWLPDRLARGVKALSQAKDPSQPALFCSRTWITDNQLATRRLSAPRPRDFSFRNALVQNIASGNTILLNPAAAKLIVAAAQKTTMPVVHDWWVYQLITGAGGAVVHDDTPTLLYRQHDVNQIGANDSAKARFKRVLMLLSGHFREWNTVNIAALRSMSDLLTPESRQILEAFDRIRSAGLIGRLKGLHQLGLYRQSTASTFALWIAALIKRL